MPNSLQKVDLKDTQGLIGLNEMFSFWKEQRKKKRVDPGVFERGRGSINKMILWQLKKGFTLSDAFELLKFKRGHKTILRVAYLFNGLKVYIYIPDWALIGGIWAGCCPSPQSVAIETLEFSRVLWRPRLVICSGYYRSAIKGRRI